MTDKIEIVFTPATALNTLRDLGYVVVAWTPEEVEGVDAGDLEDIVTERGNNFIEDTKSGTC